MRSEKAVYQQPRFQRKGSALADNQNTQFEQKLMLTCIVAWASYVTEAIAFCY